MLDTAGSAKAETSAPEAQAGDAFVERREKFLACQPHCRGVRVGAQENQDFVETNQRGGIGETAPPELGQKLLRAQAIAWLEAPH